MSEIQQARELEKFRSVKLIEDLNAEERARTVEVNSQMAARGASHSGARLQALWKVRAEKLRKIIDRRIEIRRDLARSFPALGSAQELAELLSSFEEMLSAAHIHDHTMFETTRRAIEEDEIFRLRAHARREVEILKREFELNLDARANRRDVTVNTSGEPAVVNLGVLYGGVQQAISHVN